MNDPIMRTDQTRCHGADGAPIPCGGTGQDAETRAGAPWPEPRFEAAGETVRDRLTGRVWTRNANPAEFPLSRAEALDFVAEMNAETAMGHADWRLPDRRELFGLMSHARINPALPEGHPFAEVFPGYYWTATSVARLPNQTWYVHLGGARVFKGMKHGAYMVWPVRGGGDGRNRRFDPTDGEGPDGRGPNGALRTERRVPAPRMVPGDGTVADRWTGRIWTRNADLAEGPVSWETALDRLARLNRDRAFGFSDWRLPSIRELESLVDAEIHSPAIAEARVFENPLDFYWSSTTSAYDPTYAWTLYARDGVLGVGYKANPEFGVWAVRGGTVGTAE